MAWKWVYATKEITPRSGIHMEGSLSDKLFYFGRGSLGFLQMYKALAGVWEMGMDWLEA